MDPIRIFLVDDHRIFLEGLVRLLQDHSSMKIIGTARDGREALRQIQILQPDVVLMDIAMPNLNGVEATRLITKASPKTKILILSMHENEEFLRRVLEAGAIGYLLKDSTADELFLAIEEVHRGNSYLSPPLSRKLIADYIGTKGARRSREPALTGREQEVLQLLAEGHSNQATAKYLNLSPKTVETHRKNIMKKLKLHRITDLVRYAIRRGIIES
jgi:DNA-binding NarL/FixJ family response regulator